MGLEKIQETKQTAVLPPEKQQAALDENTIKLLKSQINVFDGTEKLGPDIGGSMEIHKGSIFSYTPKIISNTRVVKTPTGPKTETTKQSYTYSDPDGNGTFDILTIETRDANGNLIKTTKYGKTKDDNVSNYDKEIPQDAEKK